MRKGQASKKTKQREEPWKKNLGKFQPKGNKDELRNLSLLWEEPKKKTNKTFQPKGRGDEGKSLKKPPIKSLSSRITLSGGKENYHGLFRRGRTSHQSDDSAKVKKKHHATVRSKGTSQIATQESWNDGGGGPNSTSGGAGLPGNWERGGQRKNLRTWKQERKAGMKKGGLIERVEGKHRSGMKRTSSGRKGKERISEEERKIQRRNKREMMKEELIQNQSAKFSERTSIGAREEPLHDDGPSYCSLKNGIGARGRGGWEL